MSKIQFQVRDNGILVNEGIRSPRKHSGWLSVQFLGKRYVLNGRIRTGW